MDHHNPEISLLRDNPVALITPVQGGGGNSRLQRWTSSPVQRSVKSSINPIKATHTELTKFQKAWGSVKHADKKSASSDIVCKIGHINVLDCPTYSIAPLR